MSLRLTFVIAFLALTAAAVHAQAPAPAAPPPPPRHEGSAEFAFVGTGGNSETQTIGLGGEIIYRPTDWETRAKFTYVRNESDDQLKAQAATFLGRAQHVINPRLFAYGQYGFLRDRFAGIAQRHTAEGGLAYLAINAPPQKLTIDGGFGYAREQRILFSDLNTATAGTGGIYVLTISPSADLSEDAHILFALNETEDWRFANAVSLTAKVNSVFSLKVSNNLRYVHAPVPGFKKTDFLTSIALVAKF